MLPPSTAFQNKWLQLEEDDRPNSFYLTPVANTPNISLKTVSTTVLGSVDPDIPPAVASEETSGAHVLTSIGGLGILGFPGLVDSAAGFPGGGQPFLAKPSAFVCTAEPRHDVMDVAADLSRRDVSIQGEPSMSGASAGCGCTACGLPPVLEVAYGTPDLAPMAKDAPDGTDGPSAIVIDSTVSLRTVPTGGLVACEDTFRLHSLPGSKFTIYLDFDGHTTTGTSWNSYWSTSSFYSPAFSTDTSESFNATELLRIQQIWQRVSEYYSPFNINVTTEDPGLDALTRTSLDDNTFGVRVVVTDEGGKNFGGIGYKGSFSWMNDTPVFVYANRLSDSAKRISDAVAHEVGHSLGLSHDGSGTNQYYYGHGSGVTDWAPIMGVGYNANIVQWSNGGYTGASNLEDDLSIITTQNMGVSFRQDDWGNTFSTAGLLQGRVVNNVAQVETYGIISGSGARNDVDMFRFAVAAGGSIDLTVSAWTRAFVGGSSTPIHAPSTLTMLDVGLTLFDGTFKSVATWDDISRLDGRISLSGVAGGVYYLAVDGVGWGNPTGATLTGYSEYGSLGQYMVRGTYTASVDLVPELVLNTTAITTTEGGSTSFMLRALNARDPIVVSVDGLNSAEGRVSSTDILLNASNNWQTTITVWGVDDRNADTQGSYNLTLSTSGSSPVTIAVSNLNDDTAPSGPGRAFGSYTTASSNNNNTISALASDNGTFFTVREGMTAAGATIDFRWQFANLRAGDKLVQVDAWSAQEAFRLEYSTDNAASWRNFDGAPTGALTWNGSWLASGVGSSLWVRLMDQHVAGDTVRDTISVDLLTIREVPADWLMA